MDKIGNYKVEVFKTQYAVNSTDNDHYDLVYLEDAEYIWPTIIGLKIYEDTGVLFKVQ